MVNKRGWLRIVEAFVAILIVFAAVLTVSTTQRGYSGGDICTNLNPLVEEIAEDGDIRNAILTDDPTAKAQVESFLASRIKNPSITSEVKICELQDTTSCTASSQGEEDAEICAEDRVIAGMSGNTATYKKLKIFLFKSKNVQ